MRCMRQMRQIHAASYLESRVPRHFRKLGHENARGYRCVRHDAYGLEQGTDLLLDAFWEARGVFDAKHRQELVKAASLISSVEQTALVESQPLPGVSNIWTLRSTAPEVIEVSRRLIYLQQLLGGKDADVVWMVTREPALLTADFEALTQRLFDMKMAAMGSGIDLMHVITQQPALLLSSTWSLDRPQTRDSDGSSTSGTAASTSGRSDDSEESQASMQRAWQYGLSSDGSEEWSASFERLALYRQQHGDSSVGFRDGDDAGLVRWVRKQRADQKHSALTADRHAKLESLGFAFSEEDAEWQRWFNELQSFQQVSGHCNPMPLSAGVDFYLINWCSVQRIARRSRLMLDARVALLDSIGFDWTGADPLS